MMMRLLSILGWLVLLGMLVMLVTGVALVYVDAGSAIATEACP